MDRAGILFVVMMMRSGLMMRGSLGGSRKNSNNKRKTCLIFQLSNGRKFEMLTLVIGPALMMKLLYVIAPMLIQ
jgi:hypothetical protein